jgi:hypothetical protein
MPAVAFVAVILQRPHDHMRHTGANLLVAAGAPVRLRARLAREMAHAELALDLVIPRRAGIGTSRLLTAPVFTRAHVTSVGISDSCDRGSPGRSCGRDTRR